MLRSISGVAAVVGLFVAGCKREPPAAAEAIAAQAAATTTPAPSSTPAPARAAPAPPGPATPQVRPELLALREARRLAKAGDLRGAWETIGPVAQASTSDGHLLCEAGFIAHRDGRGPEAEQLLRRGVGALARDNTRPGRHGRAMCLYNLALVHEAAGALGEAVCELRRSEALRSNKTVAAKQRELAGKIAVASLRCEVGRVARGRDVREVAREWAETRDLKITGSERSTVGGFAVHVVRLATRDGDDALAIYEDVAYVVLDDAGRLFPLGVFGYVDRSATYFRGWAGFRIVGSYTSPLGALVLFELDSGHRGDAEHVDSSSGIAEHSNRDLLVCRRAAAPDGDVACAQVPIAAREEPDEESQLDEPATGGSSGAEETGEPPGPRRWGAAVSYRYDEASGTFVFELDDSDGEVAGKLGLPLGSIAVGELFARFKADAVGLDL